MIEYRSGMHATYLKIAREHAALFEENNDKINAWLKTPAEGMAQAMVDEEPEQYFHLRRHASVIAVTFAGMAIEAFLYDYAAQKLGDRYVQDNLDKMDVKSKYLVYPQIAYQKVMDKSGHQYERLKNLVKLRNELVHYKSRHYVFEDLEDLFKHNDGFQDRLIDGVKNSVVCVESIVQQFDAMHPELGIKEDMSYVRFS